MNYLVMLEVILSAVYAVEVFSIDAKSYNIYWLIILIYACLKLFLYVVYDKKINKNLSIFILILVGAVGWFYYPLLLFFPLCFNQMNTFSFKKGWGISVLTLALIFIIPDDFVIVFLMSYGFSTILVYMQMESAQKLSAMDEKLDAMQKSKDKMKHQLETYSQVNENTTYQSQLEERNKLSQALHDELGHTLSGNILRLEAIKVTMDKDTQKSQTMLQGVIDNLRSGMDSIRGILKASKPEVSTVNIANLKLMIDKVSAQSDVNIKLKYNSDVSSINPSMWQAIIPNIKEALTNMMKYSSAQNCEIEFAKLNKLYRVRIADDGIGCMNIEKGLGLTGIEERMALIDGNAIFDGSDGFSIVMIFPI